MNFEFKKTLRKKIVVLFLAYVIHKKLYLRFIQSLLSNYCCFYWFHLDKSLSLIDIFLKNKNFINKSKLCKNFKNIIISKLIFF